MRTWQLVALVALVSILTLALTGAKPSNVRIVDITQVNTDVGAAIFAAASDGPIHAAANTGGSTLQAFQQVGQVPSTPVSIESEVNVNNFVYVATDNGDVYRATANGVPPYTFTLQRIVFGP